MFRSLTIIIRLIGLNDTNYSHWLYLREIGWDSVDWIDLAQDREQWRALVNTVMNLRVP
jgi:hypothetical protein